MYARKQNSGLRRQRKAEGGRGYQLFSHPRHVPPGLAKNSDCGRAGRAGGHNPPPFGLRAEPANTGTPPLPCRLFPHPPQNRLPRGARAPVALCRAGLGSRLGRCWAFPTGEQHPSRQPRLSPSATSKIIRYRFCGAWLFR